MALVENVKKLWQTWDVRGFILISLFIQFFLLFCTPFRKRTKNWFVHKSIWLAYLAADWVAAFVVLLILHCPVSPSADEDLLVYWTPFLLIHLGGPDTITAFSFEDNELWDRHLLQFLGQVGATSYLFYQSLDSNNKLFAPTLLIYLAGIIKYGERIRSLYLASLDSSSNTTRNNDERLAKVAFCLFRLFQETIVDINFTFAQRDKIRDFLLNTSAEEAFRIMEMELNMFYEVLYTKVLAFHQPLGYILRFVSFSSILISLVLWCVTVFKSGLHKTDVKITYTLLVGALAMDIIAFTGLALSDWIIGCLLQNIDADNGIFWSIKAFSLHIMTRLKFILPPKKETISGILYYRWSRSIPQYNLYKELKRKAEHAENNPEARGHDSSTLDRFQRWLTDLEYDDSLLKWHFSSEFLLGNLYLTGSTNHREYCKVLSRYMMHLVKKQPTLMSSVAGLGGRRFLEAYKEFQQPNQLSVTDVISLNMELDKNGDGKWEIMSKVWLDFLCYAATECRPRNLIAQVSEGGELITYVWSLMTHLGLGKHYRKPDISAE